MASKAKIDADQRRRATVARHAAKRTALREQARTAATDQDRLDAYAALSRLPRDASPTRVRNRDKVDGRPRRLPARDHQVVLVDQSRTDLPGLNR